MGDLRRLPIIAQGSVMPYVWLIYAAAIPISLWLADASPRAAVFQGVVLCAFLVAYFAGYGSRGRGAAAVTAVMFVLGAVAAPRDSVATTYFIYGASFIAWGFTSDVAYRALFAYVPLVAIACWLLHVNLYGAVPGVVFSLIVGVACVAQAEQCRSNARLRQANDEIERLAQIAERERIARDLHDVLGHTLSVITLKSQLAAKLADRDPARAASEIREVESIARTSLDELRAAVAGYRAAGIADELAHARDVLTSAGLRVHCEADDVRLAPVQESVLALAIRESVTNVVRHARASAVRLRLASAGDACRFEIADDGIGGAAGEGMGLLGMRERLAMHGGSLERSTDRGTQLVITVPTEAAR